MNLPLQHITLNNFETSAGLTCDIPLSYELFGQPLHTAPIVLVNHALTGNSTVAGENGWWKTLVGEGKIIDTNKFTVLCFNIPGNGYDGFFIDDYKDFKTVDIAKIFLLGLKNLHISKLHTLIGGSVGGGIVGKCWLFKIIWQNISFPLQAITERQTGFIPKVWFRIFY